MRLLIVVALLMCFTSLQAQSKLVLVDKGQSRYSIVISSAADENEQTAAAILQETFTKISGVTIPVIRDNVKAGNYEIIIGKTNRLALAEWKRLTNDLKEDGYFLKTHHRNLIIAGGTGKGIIYGVTGFLEEYLGCRYYAPGVEYIPSIKKIAIGAVNNKQVPPALIRIIHGKIPEDINYRNWRKLTTVAQVWNDGGWRGYYVHTFNRLVPPAQYFQSHPEYFSLVNGKRIQYGQLCLTNKDVFDIALKKLKEDIAAHPQIKYWSVSQNDTYDNCQCDNCRKLDEEEGSPAGSLLYFVNKIAAEFPDKIITTLAYQYTRKPPLHIKPLANVMVTLCTIELNRSLPIETDPGSTSFKNDIIGWSRICSNIMLWDYEVQFTNYLCPFPLFHTLQPNIQFFTKYGVTAHFQQSYVTHGVEFAELKAYLLSKLLWNPNADAKAIINDFIKGYYREAAPFIQEYFDLLHKEAALSKQGLDIYGTPVWSAKTFLSPSLIKKYYDLFDKAGEAVKDKPELLERVKIDRLCVQYADMEIAKTDMFGENGWYKIDNGKYILREDRKQLLEEFYAVCKRNNIVELNEGGLTADIYYNNTRRFIDVQVEGNLAFKKPVTVNPQPSPKYTGDGASLLTNGVKGTDDYKINWLGWEGKDVEVVVDLQQPALVKEVTVSSLQYPKSWILHPLKVVCLLSNDGVNYKEAGVILANEDLQQEQQMKNFSFVFNGAQKIQSVKLLVTASKQLPAWHNYAGNMSWVFIDEVIIK